MIDRLIPVTFLPTGEIDPVRTTPSHLALAKTILEPSIPALLSRIGNTGRDLDLLKFLNWLFVSYYWLFLQDFGQVAPTTYPYTDFVYNGPGLVNLSQPAITHASTNNIFVNQTLFDIYDSYMRSTTTFQIPVFAGPKNGNGLERDDALLLQSYSCLQRQWKPPLNVLISVLSADYALFFGLYSFVLLIAGAVQSRRKKGNSQNQC